MKRLLLIVGLAIGALGFAVTPAVASNAGGTTVVHYSLAYTDFGGPVNCIGVHQTGKNFPGTTTSGGQDSFTCTSTTGSALTGVTPGQVIPIGVNGWQSDYFIQPQFGGIQVLNTIAFNLTVSADGFSYSGVAPYYPPPS
jgi:hypothetical protein